MGEDDIERFDDIYGRMDDRCRRRPPRSFGPLHPIVPRAVGRKVSDEWTVPLCATHHRALHSVGDEEKWWKERQVDPIILAKQLWREAGGASCP